MSERFIVFDVETPNSFNNRMSSIGITIVEDRQIICELDTLVNPQTHFDMFNVELTGITPEMAKKGPVFPELWSEIENIMSSGVLVAHNASFDIGVLAKCLRDYGISWKAKAAYICTCRLGKVCYPNLYNHRLNTLCGSLGIALDHHRAGSDSHAAACLLIDYLKKGIDPTLYLKEYDLNLMKTISGNNRKGKGAFLHA